MCDEHDFFASRAIKSCVAGTLAYMLMLQSKMNVNASNILRGNNFFTYVQVRL